MDHFTLAATCISDASSRRVDKYSSLEDHAGDVEADGCARALQA